jgi:hypothetical protein
MPIIKKYITKPMERKTIVMPIKLTLFLRSLLRYLIIFITLSCLVLIGSYLNLTYRVIPKIPKQIALNNDFNITFKGKAHLAMLPDITIVFPNVTIASNLENAPTLSSRQARLEPKLLDALLGRISIKTIDFRQPTVHLQQSFSQTARNLTEHFQTQPVHALINKSLAHSINLHITHGTILYHQQKTTQPLLTHITFNGTINGPHPETQHLKAIIPVQQKGSLSLDATGLFSWHKNGWEYANTHATLAWQQHKIHPLWNTRFNMDIQWHKKTQSLIFNKIEANLLVFSFHGHARYQPYVPSSPWTVTLDVLPFNVAELFGMLNLKQTQVVQNLDHVAGTVHWKSNQTLLLNTTINHSKLNVIWQKSWQHINLTLDHLDLNQDWPAAQNTPPSQPKKDAKALPEHTLLKLAQAFFWRNIRPLQINIEQIKWQHHTLKNFAAPLNLSASFLEVPHFNASLYDGQLAGKMYTKKQPDASWKIGCQLNVKTLNVAQISAAMLLDPKLTGIMDMNLSVASNLKSWPIFWQKIHGYWSMAIRDGSVATPKILQTFNQLIPPVKKQKQKAKQTKSFAFDHLGLRGEINGTRWHIQQANLKSQPWVLRGTGDYNWHPTKLSASIQLVNTILRKQIKADIFGPWNQLSVKK